MAYTIERELGTVATNTFNLAGATAGNLGVILYNLNNGTTTDGPTKPSGWEDGPILATTSGGVPTGTYTAQFWKVLTGSEGNTVIGGATTAGSRQYRFKEVSTDQTGGTWQLVDTAGAGANRGGSTVNSIASGSLDVGEDGAVVFANGAWHSSIASGVDGPAFSGSFTVQNYDRFAGTMAVRTLSTAGTVSTTMTLADSLTRYLSLAVGAYSYVLPPPEPDLTIPIGIKTASGIYWTTAIFKRP